MENNGGRAMTGAALPLLRHAGLEPASSAFTSESAKDLSSRRAAGSLTARTRGGWMPAHGRHDEGEDGVRGPASSEQRRSEATPPCSTIFRQMPRHVHSEVGEDAVA